MPYTIFGVSGVLSGLWTFFLPETKGEPMNQTIEELVENIEGLTDTGLSWSQNTSCFFARQFTRARKKHSLVSTFRLTQIDILSTLVVINKIWNKQNLILKSK